jgi:hypothetical protein
MEVVVGGKISLIDPEDLPIFEAGLWRLWSHGYVAQRRRDESGKRVVTLFHRVIIGAKPGEMVDHVNGNPLDNRRCNLRICTHAENMRNRKMAKHNRSGIKGAYRHGQKWVSEIVANGVRYRLGTFDTPQAAGAAYAEAASRLHGEFARAA